jgi:hypothetical protein
MAIENEFQLPNIWWLKMGFEINIWKEAKSFQLPTIWQLKLCDDWKMFQSPQSLQQPKLLLFRSSMSLPKAPKIVLNLSWL